jgi:hypothetical protein
MKSSSQKRQHVLIIPGSLLATSAHAGPGCSIATYEVDCDLAQDGQVARGNPVTDAAVILTERDIQNPMEPGATHEKSHENQAVHVGVIPSGLFAPAADAGASCLICGEEIEAEIMTDTAAYADILAGGRGQKERSRACSSSRDCMTAEQSAGRLTQYQGLRMGLMRCWRR